MKAGNGAREALDAMAGRRLGVPGLSWADWVLAELWDRGFKVVPLGDDRADDHTAMLMAEIERLQDALRERQVILGEPL